VGDMETLIVYASKYGCSENCANLLAKELGGKVELYNLKGKQDIDLNKYDTIIIGGSIYVGKIQKTVTEFYINNLATLLKKSIGLYICGMQTEESAAALERNFPPELVKAAIVKEYFGGEFNFEKMNFIEKMVVKKVSKITSTTSFIKNDNINNFAAAVKLG
jgi:menaquinone-dependent protoporphyrinogen oxidase